MKQRREESTKCIQDTMLGGFPLNYTNYMEFCLSVKNLDTLDLKIEALETLLISLGIWFHSLTVQFI